MQIKQIALKHFRNYRALSLEPHPDCNVITGENAQGKTNLLEAICCLSWGKSPRVKSDRELIQFQENSACLKAIVLARQRNFQMQLDFSLAQRKRLLINQVNARSSGLHQVYQVVYFSPEDLNLIRESAAVRRKFMDTALCQLYPRYSDTLKAYKKAYEQKTRILRDSHEHPNLLAALPEFNEQLVIYGASLIQSRAGFVQALQSQASAQHSACSGNREKLELHYQTVSSITNPQASIEILQDLLRSHMNAHYQAELASRLCLSGPHKDDLLVSINGLEARRYASQGQIRTATLSLKLAERELYQNAFGEYPVLLLDDVLSELDPRRQEFVLNRIGGGQVFITCCEEDRLPRLLGGKVFRIHQGTVT